MQWGGNLSGNERPTSQANDPNRRYLFDVPTYVGSSNVNTTILGYKLCDQDGPNYRCRANTPSEGWAGGELEAVYPEFVAPGWTVAQVKKTNAGRQQFLESLKSTSSSAQVAQDQRINFTIWAAGKMGVHGPKNALDLLVAYAEAQKGNPQGMFDYDTAVQVSKEQGGSGGYGINMADFAMTGNAPAGGSGSSGGGSQEWVVPSPQGQGTASDYAPAPGQQTALAVGGEPESSGMSTTTKVVIAVGALAVVGVIVALVLKKRKKAV